MITLLLSLIENRLKKLLKETEKKLRPPSCIQSKQKGKYNSPLFSVFLQTTMNVTGNETTADNVTNTWENASLYYSMPSDDPDLLGCQPIILKTELQVRMHNHCQNTNQHSLTTQILLASSWALNRQSTVRCEQASLKGFN